MSGGTKHDGNKPRMDLLDPQFLMGIAQVLGFGAKKYGDYNWQKGFDHSRLYAAIQRHLNKYWKGQNEDEESGMHELLHAACGLMMLYWHSQNLSDRDDRPLVSPGNPTNVTLLKVGDFVEDTMGNELRIETINGDVSDYPLEARELSSGILRLYTLKGYYMCTGTTHVRDLTITRRYSKC